MTAGWLTRFDDARFSRAFRAARKTAAGTLLESYYSAVPPPLDQSIQSTPITALDFEMDGLDIDDQLLEAGWVNLQADSIKLESARRLRIRSKEALNEKSVVIHQITDDLAAQGLAEADVLETLARALSGRVILAHAAMIERSFLDAACRRSFGVPFVGRFICTMQLEERWFPASRTSDGLRLGKLRSQYGLPQYRAHDGLTDALSCAELFLAQCARRASPDIQLRHVLMR